MLAAAGSLFLCICLLVGLSVIGYVRFLRLHADSMAPAIQGDDDICVERLTYLFRQPRRGDIIIFKANDIPQAKLGELYVKRVVGLPGERLRLSGGTLYVNEQPVLLRNRAGDIRYASSTFGTYLRDDGDACMVPEATYFVLGDNPIRSFDSRMWGSVPASAVVGRVAFCYEPAKDAGWVR